MRRRIIITTAAIPEPMPLLQPQSLSTLLNAILISSISQFIPHNMNGLGKVEQYGKKYLTMQKQSEMFRDLKEFVY